MRRKQPLQKATINDLNQRLIGIPLVAALGMLMSGGNSMIAITESFLLSGFFTFTLWHAIRWLVIQLRTRYPGLQNTKKRIFYQLGIGIPFTLLFMSSFCVCYGLVKFGTDLSLKPILINTSVGLIITIFISTIYECVYFFQQWKISLQEAEELKRQKVISQFETLKSQVNPHFLFNSLNTLTVLIEENQQQAVQFVQELSQVYRYVLNAREKNTVPLSEELQFIRAYLYLLRIRFGDHLQVELNVDPKLEHQHLPPLALQLLVENAIKHNIVSAAQPLRLRISAPGNGQLEVSNDLQKKTQTEHSSGFGLNSIIERYKLLGNASVLVNDQQGHFSVTLPLLDPLPA